MAVPNPFKFQKGKPNSKGLYTIWIELPRHGLERRRKPIRSVDWNVCVRKATEEKKRLLNSGDLPEASMTVEQWMKYWLTNIQWKRVTPRTFENDESMVRAHINPAIGKVRLDKLTPLHIEKVHAYVLDRGKAHSTALRVHATMGTAFAAAVRLGHLKENVATRAEKPRVPQPELEVLTMKEVQQIIDLFSVDDQERYLWATIMLTGGRRGEVLGLTWDRVTDVIDFRWQLQRQKAGAKHAADYKRTHLAGGLFLVRPKSKSGRRIYPLKGQLAEMLEQWRRIAPTNRHNLVFATIDGEPIDPNLATKAWPKVLEAAKITKKVRVHDLRHTAVDAAYAAKIPEALIMELFGHSVVSVTRGYRSKDNRELLDQAAAAHSAQFQITG